MAAQETPTELRAAGIDLGQALIRALHAWGEEHGNEANFAVLMIGFHHALVDTFKQLPPDRRPGHAERLSAALFKSVGRLS